MFTFTIDIKLTLDCLQINMFVSRLTGEPIGFTVLGIFVIDKNTILTVCYHRQSSVMLFYVNIIVFY